MTSRPRVGARCLGGLSNLSDCLGSRSAASDGESVTAVAAGCVAVGLDESGVDELRDCSSDGALGSSVERVVSEGEGEGVPAGEVGRPVVCVLGGLCHAD